MGFVDNSVGSALGGERAQQPECEVVPGVSSRKQGRMSAAAL